MNHVMKAVCDQVLDTFRDGREDVAAGLLRGVAMRLLAGGHFREHSEIARFARGRGLDFDGGILDGIPSHVLARYGIDAECLDGYFGSFVMMSQKRGAGEALAAELDDIELLLSDSEAGFDGDSARARYGYRHGDGWDYGQDMRDVFRHARVDGPTNSFQFGVAVNTPHRDLHLTRVGMASYDDESGDRGAVFEKIAGRLREIAGLMAAPEPEMPTLG